MTNAEKIQNQQESSTDIIAKIVTARDEARVVARIYKYHPNKQYDYWQAIAVSTSYDEALIMFARRNERRIPEMAAEAIENFERARNGETTEMNLAAMEGLKDALASVADWMNNKEGWDS